MTINEYLNQVEQNLQNSTSREEALRIVSSAQSVLVESKISEQTQKQFWIDLYNNLGGDQDLILEKQGGDSLSSILAAAKRVIAEKVQK